MEPEVEVIGVGLDWYYTHVALEHGWLHMWVETHNGSKKKELIWPQSTFERMLNEYYTTTAAR